MNCACIFIVITTALVTLNANAGVYEYMNYMQDMNTAISTARILKLQLKNLRAEKDYRWGAIAGLLNELDAVTQEGQSISTGMVNLDGQFRARYPDFSHSAYGKTDYKNAYRTWNATTLDTLRTTLRAAGLVAGNFQNEQTLMHLLQAQGKTAQGRMQVLQVGTEIAAQNVNQLEELKRLMVNQTNAENAYMAYQVSARFVCRRQSE